MTGTMSVKIKYKDGGEEKISCFKVRHHRKKKTLILKTGKFCYYPIHLDDIKEYSITWFAILKNL